MNQLFSSLTEFLLTPAFRWFILLLRIITAVILYYNEPQRFSVVKAFDGLSFKWHLYILAMVSIFSTFLTFLGMWATIPFMDTNILSEYWYVPLVILLFAIITQITISSPQIENNGTFNPPPTYMLPLKYRMMLSYVSFIIDIILFAQFYIYLGVSDYSKRTIMSRYILERFGGWYKGNRLDFIYEWLGIFDVIYRIYILYLQNYFTACQYNLPDSWNF
jgi:hypothetical protein